MNEPNLDRFSRPLWGERHERHPTWDELARYQKKRLRSAPTPTQSDSTKIQSQFNTELAKGEEEKLTYKRNPIAIEDEADDYRRQEFEEKHTLRGRTSLCCDADVYIQTVQDFKQRRSYDAVTCWNCNQIIEEV